MVVQARARGRTNARTELRGVTHSPRLREHVQPSGKHREPRLSLSLSLSLSPIQVSGVIDRLRIISLWGISIVLLFHPPRSYIEAPNDARPFSLASFHGDLCALCCRFVSFALCSLFLAFLFRTFSLSLSLSLSVCLSLHLVT